MIFNKTFRKPSFFHWGWILAIWSTIAFISASMLYIKLDAGESVPNWWSLFGVKLVIWLFWGFLTPFIFYTGKKFRVDRKNKFIGLLYHIPASIILVSLNILLYAVIVVVINDPHWSLDSESLIMTFLALLINQFEWYFLIYWGIIIVGYAFEYYQQIKQNEINALQLESRLVKAQLQALKMQLHPHFLFNTLNTISAQIRFDEKKAAITMLAGLSDLLRRALQQREKQLLPLSEEISFIKQYLEIEKTRFKHNLDLKLDVGPGTDLIEVPGFLLQPIVENAIYHGLTKKIGAQRLEIKTSIEDEHLLITIYNDGPSLPQGFVPGQSSGIGLSSTLDRLQQLYGENHKFELMNAEQGVLATLSLPI
ncbi:MAG: histidine kinase [Roseivirga sp.]|nr:histidine kinase [Roseivirga sp.]